MTSAKVAELQKNKACGQWQCLWNLWWKLKHPSINKRPVTHAARDTVWV